MPFTSTKPLAVRYHVTKTPVFISCTFNVSTHSNELDNWLALLVGNKTPKRSSEKDASILHKESTYLSVNP